MLLKGPAEQVSGWVLTPKIGDSRVAAVVCLRPVLAVLHQAATQVSE